MHKERKVLKGSILEIHPDEMVLSRHAQREIDQVMTILAKVANGDWGKHGKKMTGEKAFVLAASGPIEVKHGDFVVTFNLDHSAHCIFKACDLVVATPQEMRGTPVVRKRQIA